jgi:hypothetical protein
MSIIQMNLITKNMWAQFIIMGPIVSIKNLKNMAWFSSKVKTQEKVNDLDFTPKFKVTYPEGWHERQTMSIKDKCDHFNNWASKL